MLTIPLLVGWELSRTRNVTHLQNPMFTYKPDGDERREELYKLIIYQLRDNAYKFIPVQDGFVTFTDKSGAPIKSSMSYEGFKQILVQNPYLILLSKARRSATPKFTMFASFMAPNLDDLRAIKKECLLYAKQVNASGTKHRVTQTDSQRKRLYAWEDYAFLFQPQGTYPPNDAKRAFNAKNGAYYRTGPLTGTKAKFAQFTQQKKLSRDDAKVFMRYLCAAYGIDHTTLKVNFVKAIAGARKGGVILGRASGQFEDIFDSAGARGLIITLADTSPHVIMHELAHVISYAHYGNAIGGTHGEHFAGVYAHVLDAYCPHIAPGRAAAFMQANGLRVRAFDPANKPATPTSRLKTHRDFEASHAITPNLQQNRHIERAFVHVVRMA